MTLNFDKFENGSTLNFDKASTDVKIDNIVVSLNWTYHRDCDLDVCVALVHNPEGYGGSSESTTLEKAGFFKKLFGGKDESPVSGRRVVDFVYFGNKKAQGVKHMGDDTTGRREAGEFIYVDLKALPSNVNEVIPSNLSYDGTRFSDLDTACMRVYVGDKQRVDLPLLEVDLKGQSSEVMGGESGRLLRGKDGEWVWTTNVSPSYTLGRPGIDVLSALAAK